MGKTLLLADDSVTIQKVVGISFASEDIAITTVDNGDDAIQRARELKPDLILADVVMPGKSGYEVCEAIKSDAQLSHIPVLLLTGTFEAFDEERAKRAGAAGHVAKPFEAQTLVERVKELLAQTAAAPPPAPPAAAPPPPPKRQPAAQAAAPPRPQTAPAQPAAPAGGDSAFDFFDEPSADAARVAAPAAGVRADLEMDDSADAFAFDEDDLGTAGLDSAASAPPEPAAHTVAILPDDPAPEASASELPPLRPPSATANRPPPPLSPPPGGSGAASAPATPAPATPSPGSSRGAGSSEAFDFEFESAPPARPAAPAPDPAETPAEGIAESMLLDPAGDSAHDVSSSQLGDLDVAPPADPRPAPENEPHAATQLMDTAPPVAAPAAPKRAPAPAPAAPSLDADPVLEADPLEDGLDDGPSAGFVDETPTGAPSRAADPMEFATSESVSDANEASWSQPLDPEPISAGEASEADVEPAMEVEPLSEPEPVAPAEPSSSGAAMSDDALAQIAPALREQLHETLEKIAWEAFGQVTETVVAQSVERIERIAWEVVPKLAETLIAEEIRKLKE